MRDPEGVIPRVEECDPYRVGHLWRRCTGGDAPGYYLYPLRGYQRLFKQLLRLPAGFIEGDSFPKFFGENVSESFKPFNEFATLARRESGDDKRVKVTGGDCLPDRVRACAAIDDAESFRRVLSRLLESDGACFKRVIFQT